MSLQKQKAKLIMNAAKANQQAIKTPIKPKKSEDKRQSGFAPQKVSQKYPGSYGEGMTIPKRKR